MRVYGKGYKEIMLESIAQSQIKLAMHIPGSREYNLIQSSINKKLFDIKQSQIAMRKKGVDNNYTVHHEKW